MKPFLILFSLLCFTTCVFGQKNERFKYLGREMTLGIGGLISGDFDMNDKYYSDFYLINSKIAVTLTKKISIGLRDYEIWEKPLDKIKAKYRILGPYIQWDYLKIKDLNLWVESGYLIGNYCSCGYSYAIDRPNTTILLIGGGAEVRLFNNFYLEISIRKGLLIPKVSGVDLGDIGLFAHAGINYRLRMR
ncbi:MAG: hypothetical protein WCR52_20430 [Bacteroidota bacterium]